MHNAPHLHLAVVYGLKTADYGWLHSFYPVARIKDECAARSVRVEFFFPADVLTMKPAELQAFDVVLLRGDIPSAVYDVLEHCSIPHVNSHISAQIANDKAALYPLLKETTVKMIPILDTSHMSETDFPIVIKPRFGSQGRGITKVDTAAEFENVMRRIGNSDDYIVQQCETASSGKDVRVFFCNQTICGCFRRTSPHFLSNAAQGGKTEAIHLPLVLKEWTDIIIKKTRLFTGTADYLYSDTADGFVLCEVNASPGFMHAERDTGCNTAGIIIDGIISYCRQKQLIQ